MKTRSFWVLGLRPRLVLAVFLLVGGAAGLLTPYFLRIHLAGLRQVTEQRTQAMRRSLKERAETLAHNSAVSSASAAVMMDFSLLQRAVAATAKQDPEVVYALITDGKNRIVVHSDQAKVGGVFATPAGGARGDGGGLAARELKVDGKSVIEVTAPIKVGDDWWGNVRYALSLASVERQIAATEVHVRAVRTRTLTFSGLAILAVLILALLATTVATRRMIRGVRLLEEGMRSALAGQREVRVTVAKPAEMKRLADGFAAMLDTVRERDKALATDELRMDVAVAQARRTDETKANLVSKFTQNMMKPIDDIGQLAMTLRSAFREVPGCACPQCKQSFELGHEGGGPTTCPTCASPLSSSTAVILGEDPGPQRDRLLKLTEIGTGLLKLVNGVLDLAKADAQSKRLQTTEALDVSLLAAAAKEHVTAVCADARRISWPVLKAPLTIEGDAARLKQAVGMAAELVVRLTSRGAGPVRVEIDGCSFGGAPGVQLVIREEGPGLTSEILEALKNGTSADLRSTMAVLLVQQVVELHQGEFSLQSEVGRGTNARLVLPERQRPGVARAAGGAAA